MSNANRKAKGTTMVDKKLAKARERIENLEQRLQSAQMQVLNMRQMYEASVQEKQAIQSQLTRVNQILTAAVVQARGKSITLKEKTLAKLEGFVGVNTVAEEGDLVITAITRAEFEAMNDFEDEIEDDDEE